MLQKEPQILFNEYIELYEALFPLLIKELDTVEDEKIILEGSILLPKFIEKLKEKHDVEICYMITDDNFVNKKYIKRDYVQEMLTKLNGEIALKNLLARDQIFAKYILDELEKHPFIKIHMEADNGFEGYFIKLQKVLKL
ncbi:hypothetical protein [Dethiothermospora halolimnae]|uniref:hypothetical protein n=1 Tax=Dethiothermospora halolimnae TaxID=3114390 RepID=UPI003CCB8469